MKYSMQVIIYDPKTPKEKNSDIVMNLTAEFWHNADTYGNGYYVTISDGHGFENVYDLRYNTDFHKNKKEVFLTEWAYSYWCGEKGAYAIKSYSIKKIQGEENESE